MSVSLCHRVCQTMVLDAFFYPVFWLGGKGVENTRLKVIG